MLDINKVYGQFNGVCFNSVFTFTIKCHPLFFGYSQKSDYVTKLLQDAAPLSDASASLTASCGRRRL